MGGEGDEPVLVGALTPAFPPHIVVIEAVFFLNKPECYEDGNVADDGAAVNAPGVSDGLVAGEALVGTAVAEGKHCGEGCPDRGGKQGDVFFGNLFKPEPVVLFLLAGG